jgi:diguanylate cyclase (GGDEF)-like protein/PAS domain S-box-containing protein
VSAVHLDLSGYDALLGHLPCIVYLGDGAELIYVSAAVDRLLGCPRDEVVASGLASFVHPDDAVRVAATRDAALAEGSTFVSDHRLRTADGRVVFVREESHLDESGVRQGLILDTSAQRGTEDRLATARKIAEDALRSHATRFGLVIETQRDVASAALDLVSVMRLICERTQLVTRAGAAEIVLIEDGELTLGASSGFSRRRVGDRLATQGTLSSWAFENDESAFCMDTEDDPRIEAELAGDATRSMVVVPLRHAGGTVGLIQVMSEQPDCFQIEDLNTLELLSVVLSSAMSHASEFEAKRAQVEALARFEAMVTAAVIGIAVVDRNGRVVETNPALTEILGYSPEELLGHSLNDHAHREDITSEAVAFDALMHGERDAYRLEKRYYAKNGDLVWAYVAVSPVPDADGNPHVAIEMIEDITQRKLAEKQLREHAERSEHQALHDALTGLPNRVLLHDRLEQELRQAARDDERVAVVLIDLDGFKQINDTLGHAAGDHVLCEVASRLDAAVRSSDTVARMGGDEFALVLSGQAGETVTVKLLEKLSTAVEHPMELDGLPLSVGASFGVAFYPEDGTAPGELLKGADAAMYAAKREGCAYRFSGQPS